MRPIETFTKRSKFNKSKNLHAWPRSHPVIAQTEDMPKRFPSSPTEKPNDLAACAQDLGLPDLSFVPRNARFNTVILKSYLPLGVSFIFYQLQAMLVLQVPVELPFGAIHKAANRTLQTTWKHKQRKKDTLIAH